MTVINKRILTFCVLCAGQVEAHFTCNEAHLPTHVMRHNVDTAVLIISFLSTDNLICGTLGKYLLQN